MSKATETDTKVEFKRSRSSPAGMTYAVKQDGEVVGWAKDKRAASLMTWGLSAEHMLRNSDYLLRIASGDLEAAIATVVGNMVTIQTFAQRMRFWKVLEQKGELRTSTAPKKAP